MANVWLTKKMLLEGLKLAESLPQDTMIHFNGSSEIIDDDEKTIMEITVPANGKTKVIKESFHKLLLANPSCQ
jgi:hypothetical protein